MPRTLLACRVTCTRWGTYRSGLSENPRKKGALKNFEKFTEKHVLFVIKLQADTSNFIKKDSGTGIFL